MKFYVVLLIMTVLFILAIVASGQEITITEQLLDSIEMVESNCDRYARGDRSEKTGEYRAIGSFQLWKIYVDDVNRIIGKDTFTYHDRWNRDKSRTMVRIYLAHYGKAYLKRTGQHPTYEVLARIHNGGPRGYEKKATLSYWKKVLRVLNNE